MPSYDDHKESLEAARMRDMNRQQDPMNQDMKRQQASSTQDSKRQNIHAALNNAKNMAAVATPAGAFSLLKQINLLSDMPYVAAIGAAILKDLLDLVFIGSLPGVGTAITICCSIFIFMMMILVGGRGKKGVASGIAKRAGVLLGGTLVEFMPGIDFFPVETATVLIIYVMTLSERKNAQK